MFSVKVLFILCVCVPYSWSDNEENWIAPDAWGRSSSQNINTEKLLCPKCDCDSEKSNNLISPQLNLNAEDKATFTYYKILIKFLFDRKQFEHNEKTNSYQRGILFDLTKSEIEKLEKLEDPRDLDSIVSEILQKSKPIKVSERSKTNWIISIFRFFKSCFTLTFSMIFSLTEIRFELLIVIAVLVVIYIKKMYGVSLILILLSGIFLMGYTYKYYECNRKLEIDEMHEFYNLKNNPCHDNSQKEPSSIWNLWNMFKPKPSEAECREYYSKKNRLRIPYCRPDKVLFEYLNEIVLDQFHMTVEKSTHIFKELNEMIPFPYNIVASIIFCATLVTFLQLFFKYIISPKVWCGYWQNRNNSKKQHEEESNNKRHDAGDRLTGDNLKYFLEICKEKLDNKINYISHINLMTSGVEVLTSKSDTLDNKKINEKIIESVSEASTSKSISKYDSITSKSDTSDNEKINEKIIEPEKNDSIKVNPLEKNNSPQTIQQPKSSEKDIIEISSESSLFVVQDNDILIVDHSENDIISKKTN